MRLIAPTDAALPAAGILYAEDFDLPAATGTASADRPVPAPHAAPHPASQGTLPGTPDHPPPPVFDTAAVEAARMGGYEDGLAEGAARAAEAAEADLAQAVRRIAAALDDAAATAVAAAEAAAQATAELLLACLSRALPALCRRHGPAEAAAVARAILPGLRAEPAVTLRAAPETAAAVAAAIARHDEDLAGRLRVVPTDALPPGDVRIDWADGEAVRDVAAIWGATAATLAASGIALPCGPDIVAPPAADAASPVSTRELQHVG